MFFPSSLQGVGLLIEFWKIGKAVDVHVGLHLGFPFIQFKNKLRFLKFHINDISCFKPELFDCGLSNEWLTFTLLTWCCYLCVCCGFNSSSSYEESRTAEYDRMAMTYLSYALYPLVIGYSIYSLVYDTHKSWYSWILGSLVGTVYTFGFIMVSLVMIRTLVGMN